MTLREDISPQRDLFSGNQVRAILQRYGFPNPDRRLIDALAPVEQNSPDGSTLRMWRVRKDVIAEVFQAMKPSFDELELLRYGDAGIFETKLKETIDLFYRKLAETDKEMPTV